jgi:hypothetical protein
MVFFVDAYERFVVHSEMPTSHSVWIPCKVDKGMFSSESAVEITVDGQTVSLFADKSLIKKIKGVTYIQVTLVGPNGQPDHKTILLPSECFETGSRWLSIPERLLKAA